MRRRIASAVLCLSFALSALPAQAQYAVRGPSNNRATGENYHVEIGGYFWNLTSEILIASESFPGEIGPSSAAASPWRPRRVSVR